MGESICRSARWLVQPKPQQPHRMKTWSFFLKSHSFQGTFDTIHFVSSGKASAEDMISMTHKRHDSSSSSYVAQLFRLMWLNATHRSSAVCPSSIHLQKGPRTMGSPCLLLLETPCSNDFRALQESAAEKCLLHMLGGYRDD